MAYIHMSRWHRSHPDRAGTGPARAWRRGYGDGHAVLPCS